MALAMGDALERMLSSQDSLNTLLAILTLVTLIGVPLGFTLLFFVEYRIYKKGPLLTKSLYLLGIPLRRRLFTLRERNPFEISNFLGTPNIARTKNGPEHRAHQNRGYWELFLTTSQGKRVLLDRHSLKGELSKLQEFLEQFCTSSSFHALITIPVFR